MTTQVNSPSDQIFRQEIVGAKRLSNYFWAVISAIGGIGFLLAGLSSYFHQNFLIVSDTSTLTFIPQGLALSFYGVAGTCVSLYLFLTIVWNLGGGYNEFNKKTNVAKIFRWGYPGKNRKIELEFSLDEIQSVRAEIKEGINPKRMLYLKVKKRRDLPLTRVGQPISISELENQGAQLARFLQVPLEGL